MRRLRLLKVVVQAVFVVDDGETLVEQAVQPVEVTPAEWPSYATGRFAADVAQIRAQVESPTDDAGTSP